MLYLQYFTYDVYFKPYRKMTLRYITTNKLTIR